MSPRFYRGDFFCTIVLKILVKEIHSVENKIVDKSGFSNSLTRDQMDFFSLH
jgi:hypothetical protein